MKFISILISILLNLLIFACDPIDEASKNCHKFITVKNNSSTDIFFVEIGKQHLNDELPCNSIPRRIQSGSSIEIEEYWDCWEEQIDKFYKGALVLKFLADDSYFSNCVLPGTIPNNAFILTKEITTDELRANDWTIDYP